MFEEYYGFSGKPFQLTPDPEFYFRSLTHRKALSYLGYGLAQGEGFIVITGEIGSGKSTLVAHLVDTVDPSQITVAQVVTSKLDESEIIHVVAQSFGLDIEGHDKASALGAIEQLLHTEARAGRRCLLVVDESQNLSVPALEELRMLSNFQLGNHPLLQTLLLGQPEFRDTIQGHANLEQLRQRVIAAHHLEPMQRDEIEPYITWRLKKVGWKGNPAIEPQVYAEFYEATGGVPRRVNQLANRLLLMGAVEQVNRIDVSMVRAVIKEVQQERNPVARPPAAEPTVSGRPEPFAKPAENMAAIRETTPAARAKSISSAIPARTEGDSPGALDLAALEDMLAVRDAQIAELQEAVVEITHQRDDAIASALAPTISALEQAIARIEAKNAEHDRSIRQTLDMLVGWMETEMASSEAA